MKIKLHYQFINSILFILSLLFFGCSNNENSIEENSILPSITTTSISEIATSSAKSGGIIRNNDGAIITAQGICWSTNENPTLTDFITSEATDTITFTSTLSNLTSETTYYVRAYATNEKGTVYGNQQSFITEPETMNTNGIIDFDGNAYTPIKIGTQIWLKENLKTTHFLNGDVINNVIEGEDYDMHNAYYTYQEFDEANIDIYGLLYNIYSITDDRKICPEGFHVSTVQDWETLENFIGNNKFGGKLKTVGTEHWIAPNGGAINKYDFSALPGGYASDNFNQNNFFFAAKNRLAYFWQAKTPLELEKGTTNFLSNAAGYMEFYSNWGGFRICGSVRYEFYTKNLCGETLRMNCLFVHGELLSFDVPLTKGRSKRNAAP